MSKKFKTNLFKDRILEGDTVTNSDFMKLNLHRVLTDKNPVAIDIYNQLQSNKFKGLSLQDFSERLLDSNICGARLEAAYNLCEGNMWLLYFCVNQHVPGFIDSINSIILQTASNKSTTNELEKAVATGALIANLGHDIPAGSSWLTKESLKFSAADKEYFKEIKPENFASLYEVDALLLHASFQVANRDSNKKPDQSEEFSK